jgi:hypothetical protein
MAKYDSLSRRLSQLDNTQKTEYSIEFGEGYPEQQPGESRATWLIRCKKIRRKPGIIYIEFCQDYAGVVSSKEEIC